MKSYCKIMFNVLKMNIFTPGEKFIIFIEWGINFIIKILGIPVLMLGAIFAIVSNLFTILQDLCFNVTTFIEDNEVSIVNKEVKNKVIKNVDFIRKSIDKKV